MKKIVSKKELKELKDELRQHGVIEVIDAQNVKEYLRKKRKKIDRVNEEIYNVEDNLEEHDEILKMLSSNTEKSNMLIRELSNKKIQDNDISIDKIDWKNVKTF